jgi:hypothetical protein
MAFFPNPQSFVPCCLDMDKMWAAGEIDVDYNGKVSLATGPTRVVRIWIKFCPWCGKKIHGQG